MDIDQLHDVILEMPAVQAQIDGGTLRLLFSSVKTLEYFQTNINHLVKSVYDGYIGGDFVDIMGQLITGQMRDAYRRAWVENDGQGNMPDYLENSLDAFITKNVNFDWIYQYYKDIIDARVDGKPLEPLLARAQMWAARYTEAGNEAARVIALENGGKLIWVYGEAEHCETCRALNGKIAFAKEWEISGFKPQAAPNPLLECGGWQCKCHLEKTEKRRTAKVLDFLLGLATGQNV